MNLYDLMAQNGGGNANLDGVSVWEVIETSGARRIVDRHCYGLTARHSLNGVSQYAPCLADVVGDLYGNAVAEGVEVELLVYNSRIHGVYTHRHHSSVYGANWITVRIGEPFTLKGDTL
jgi:hypothetical protein